MTSIDQRCYGYEPATSQLRGLRAERDALAAKLDESERERIEIMRLWFQDADPGETRYASSYAVFYGRNIPAADYEEAESETDA